MSGTENFEILEDKVKQLVSELKNIREISQSTEVGTLNLTNKLAKIELKVKNLLAILEEE
jgi:hypothetical protein